MPALGLAAALPYYAGYGGGRSAGGPFTVESLFAAGEPGDYWDPSDLNSMYQLSTTQTPVTASGQPVGLILGKKNGLARGPEQVTGGDFSNPADWAVTAPSTITGGQLVIGAHAGGITVAANVAPQIVTIPGRLYEVSYQIISITGSISSQVGATGGVAQGGAGNVLEFVVATNTSPPRITARGGGVTSAVVDNYSVREIPGSHLVQATAGKRPTYTLASGLSYLAFDGSDDSMSSAATVDLSASDKLTVWAGIRKTNDAGIAVMSEIGTGGENGIFGFFTPLTVNVGNYFYRGKGTATVDLSVNGYTAPSTNILVGQTDIPADSSVFRINGAQVASGAGDLGTGTFLNGTLYVGSRTNSQFFFPGNMYGFILRGAASSGGQVAAGETWLNTRMGGTFL